MEQWVKFNKVMSWIVMIAIIIAALVFAIILFTTAGTLDAQYSYNYSYSYGVASNPVSGYIAALVWLGIGTLLFGAIIAVGVFALWNMLINWYINSVKLKRKYCGEPMNQAPVKYAAPVQQYAAPVAPVQQPANWQCPACGGVNNASNGFCYNCGKPRQ